MKILSWFPVIFGILGLIGVRIMEDKLFYDPFLEYFHRADENLALPDYEMGRLVFSHVFRFLLNLFFSLFVVHFIFSNVRWTAQAAILMTIVFVVTLLIYIFCVYTEFRIGYLFSFYVRRFVIQPLILLLIIPMFYYRSQSGKV